MALTRTPIKRRSSASCFARGPRSQPLNEVLRTRIFEPLGMRDTGFFTPHQDRLATAYRPTAGGLEAYDGPAGVWGRPQAFSDGAAGLVSTVDDLLAFARMLLRGGAPVLTPTAARSDDERSGSRPSRRLTAAWSPDFFATRLVGPTAWGSRPTAGSAGTAASARRGSSTHNATSLSPC